MKKTDTTNPKIRQFPQEALPLAALMALVAINLVLVPNFGRIEIKDGRLFGAMIDILLRAAPVMLIAAGMTLVIATRGIDLSVGAVMAIAGAVSAVLLTQRGLPVWMVVIIGLAVSVVAGVWNGALVAYMGIQPIVATLILMVAGRGLAQLLTDGQIVTFENRAFEYIGGGYLLGLPFPVFIAAGVFAFSLILARKTIIGAYIEAVGGNETASIYSGINAKLVKVFVYAFCGACAGMAGLIAAADIKAADPSRVGLYVELDAILAVVIGGTAFTGGRFSLSGSMLGALMIQTLTTGILMKGIGFEYTLVIKAIIVVLACLLQSTAVRDMVVRRRSAR